MLEQSGAQTQRGLFFLFIRHFFPGPQSTFSHVSRSWKRQGLKPGSGTMQVSQEGCGCLAQSCSQESEPKGLGCCSEVEKREGWGTVGCVRYPTLPQRAGAGRLHRHIWLGSPSTSGDPCFACVWQARFSPNGWPALGEVRGNPRTKLSQFQTPAGHWGSWG